MGLEYSDVPFNGPPRHYRSGRSAGNPIWIVIHCTANDASAEAEASYATRRDDSVSAHYFVDDNSIVQGCSTSDVAFHAGKANSRGIGYEITGQVFWPRDKWLASVAWPLLARQIARDCRKYAIPARWITPDQIRAGVPGMFTHNDERLAFSDTTHTDPGNGFPRDHLLALVAAALGGTPPPAPTAPPWPGRHLKYTKGRAMMRGSDVRRWQQRMADRGWRISVDGVYGPQSSAVATRFQQEKHLIVDGIVGPQTWAASWTLPTT